MRPFYIIILCSFVFSLGCAKKEKAAIEIGDIKISKEEFFQDYQNSSFYNQKDIEGFLDQYISKKLILREAERLGLDKDPKFMTDIKQYWEEGLLKLILTQKSNQFSPMAVVTEEAIANFYNKNKDTLFAGKDLAIVRQNIQDYLIREKQKEALDHWVSTLKQNINVEVHKQVLGIP